MAPTPATKNEAQNAAIATVTVRRTYRASREKVFGAWTRPEHLTRWWGPPETETPAAEVDLRPGGRYRFSMRKGPDGPLFYVTGTYREVLPPEKLVYTWTWEGTPSEVKDSVVTVAFLDRGGSTEVVVTHELLPTEKDRADHTHGWTGCLERLESHLASAL